jgi:copper homeostasis protein
LCVASLEGARLAEKHGLDRIETCIALEQGGLTPSTAFVKWIRDTLDLEQHVLIRQRAGGFHYSYDEIVVMRDQILDMRSLGVKGIVVGALDVAGLPDKQALETWKRAAGEMDLTFHRAFDDVSDWEKSLEIVIAMGFTRILTSGVSVSADVEKACALLLEKANGRIEIMMGGGLKARMVPALKALGVDAVHFSGTEMKEVDSSSLFATQLLVPDAEKIQLFLQAGL